MPEFWPFIPSQVSEKLQFRTDVRSTQTGEFRDSLHDGVSVYTLDYTGQDVDAAAIENALYNNIAGEWQMPVWAGASRLLGAISINDTAISVDTNADFREGGSLVVYDTAGQYTVEEISSVGTGTVSLAAPISTEWPIGSWVAPVGEFLLPAGQKHSLAPTTTGQTFEFYRTDNEDLSEDLLGEFQGNDLWLDPPNVFERFSGSLSRQLDFIQNGFGAMALEETETYTRWRGTVAFIDTDAASRWRRTKLLHRFRGKDRPFWMPTWKSDLKIAQVEGSSSFTLTVSNFGTTTTGLVGRSVQISVDDQLLHRSITNAVATSDAVTLTLDQSHGITIPASAKVSWLRLLRFDTDAFDMTHRLTGAPFASSFTAPVVEVT